MRQDIDLTQIHIIALSLGAQVAGQISNYLTMGQIERITGEQENSAFYFRTFTRDMSTFEITNIYGTTVDR